MNVNKRSQRRKTQKQDIRNILYRKINERKYCFQIWLEIKQMERVSCIKEIITV